MTNSPVTRQAGATQTLRKPDQSQPPHILVVEDDDDIRRMNTEVLLQSGYRVDAAENGAVAWSALTENDYDLVITDNSMPEVSGLELLKKMHAAHLLVPVIMASGTIPWREFTNALWLQPAATLVKPYTFTDLLSSVRAVLGDGSYHHPTTDQPQACQLQLQLTNRVTRRKSPRSGARVRSAKAVGHHGVVDSFAD